MTKDKGLKTKALLKNGFTPLEILKNLWFLKGSRRKSTTPYFIFNKEALGGSLTGFTLLEMIVSTGIFSVIVIASIGIMLSVSKAQLRTSNLQAIQDNIRFSTELLTKEMRTGQNYQLTTACAPTVGEEISFDATSGSRVYFLDHNKKALMRIKGAPTPTCDNAVQFTGEDIAVETFLIKLRGQIIGPNDGQPMATIALKISATDPVSGAKTIMNLQTTVLQRIRDL